jgi:uncharacterized protein
MPLQVNLRHLEEHSQRLQGKLPSAELEFDGLDEMIRAPNPLEYDLEAQLLDKSVLVQGWLRLPLHCECVRCLKPFVFEVELDGWAVALPLEGEDRVAVKDDAVDLTPPIREDILLAFPQHPLCEPGCRGLPGAAPGRAGEPGGASQIGEASSAWAELNKLKFEKD